MAVEKTNLIFLQNIAHRYLDNYIPIPRKKVFEIEKWKMAQHNNYSMSMTWKHAAIVACIQIRGRKFLRFCTQTMQGWNLIIKYRKETTPYLKLQDG